MLILLKLFLVLALLVVSIRLKLNIGLALFLGAVLLGLLFGMPAMELVRTFVDSITSYETINIFLVVFLITALGTILMHLEKLSEIMVSIESLVGSTKIVAASIPAFIGLLPMPGGAMVSAPLVGDYGKKLRLSGETMTVLNYWFRHIWEYFWPLYPAILLAAEIFKTDYRGMVATNLPMSFIAIAAGWLLILRRLPGRGIKMKRNILKSLESLVKSIWPIALVIIANLAFGVDLVLVLVVSIILVTLIYGVNEKTLTESFAKSRPLTLAALMIGVMYFRDIIEVSGAVDALPSLLVEYSIPVILVLFFVPFLAGLLTGYTLAAVGATFPVLVPFVVNGNSNYGTIMIAYMGAYLGVLMSPVHLCLVLSREYFKADWNRVYRQVTVLVGIVGLAVFALYFSGYSGFF
jgi:integral membrane protein (TIGR00529 family)